MRALLHNACAITGDKKSAILYWAMCLKYLVSSANVACDILVCALVYCNFLKKVRLGGWGTEGPKAPTLGQYVSV